MKDECIPRKDSDVFIHGIAENGIPVIITDDETIFRKNSRIFNVNENETFLDLVTSMAETEKQKKYIQKALEHPQMALIFQLKVCRLMEILHTKQEDLIKLIDSLDTLKETDLYNRILDAR